MRHQLPDKVVWWSGGESWVKMLNEKMDDSEIADKCDLVLGSGQQMRRRIGAQDFGRMRVEGYDDSCAAGLLGMEGRGGNDRLMAEMHPIKDSNGQEERSRKLAQFWNGTQDLHGHCGL